MNYCVFVSVLEYQCAVSFDLRDVDSGLVTTEPFVTCILDASLFPIHSLLSVSVKFLLFCLGSLEKYPKIGLPHCKLKTPWITVHFVLETLVSGAEVFYLIYKRQLLLPFL